MVAYLLKCKQIPYWVVSYDVLDVLPECGLLGSAALFVAAEKVISYVGCSVPKTGIFSTAWDLVPGAHSR